jgi:hypothetical protein
VGALARELIATCDPVDLGGGALFVHGHAGSYVHSHQATPREADIASRPVHKISSVAVVMIFEWFSEARRQ